MTPPVPACARLVDLNSLSYLNVPQCLRPQRCATLAAHGCHQIEYSAPHGRSRPWRARVLRQVPPAGRLGADARRHGPEGECRLPLHTHLAPTDALQRPDHNDISLALVPRDHPLIPYAALEAEGLGLLDRLLDIIHGDHRLDSPPQTVETCLTEPSDGLLVTGTLNSLGMLLQRRPVAANKIVNSIFKFNPLKLANSPMTPKNKVIIKSIERTTRALLMNIMKRYAQR